MKKIIQLSGIILSLVFCFMLTIPSTGCFSYTPEDEETNNTSGTDDTGGTDTEKLKIDEFFWGNWTRMSPCLDGIFDFKSSIRIHETGAISDNWLDWWGVLEATESTLVMTYWAHCSETRISASKTSYDEIIKVVFTVRDCYGVFYLIRQEQGVIKGQIVTNDTLTKGVGTGGLPGINVLITNTNNPVDQQTVTTDSSGNYTSDTVNVGDTYTVTPVTTNSDPVEVIPTNNNYDSGIITVTSNSYNFKTWITYTPVFIYNNDQVDLTIHIKNIGTADVTGASYSATLPSELSLISGSLKNVVGTIEPGKEKTVILTVKASTFTEIFKDAKIDLLITDYQGKTWTDYATVRIYRESRSINIGSNDYAVSGIIISEHGHMIQFQASSGNSSNKYFYTSKIPYGIHYYISTVCGVSTNETRYSIGVNAGTNPDTELNSFIETGSYEPNNTKETATSITCGFSIMSYVHKEDIDFYKINME